MYPFTTRVQGTFVKIVGTYVQKGTMTAPLGTLPVTYNRRILFNHSGNSLNSLTS